MVCLQRPAADKDQLVPRALQMRMGPRGRSGDPLTAAIRQRDAAVERHRKLECHEGPAKPLPGEKAGHGGLRITRQHPRDHLDPRCLQPRNACAIGCADRDRLRR